MMFITTYVSCVGTLTLCHWSSSSSKLPALFGLHAPVIANQPTKELTKGGDLRGARVDVPWSV